MPTSGVISFARGAPSLDLIDVEGLRQSAAAAFTRDPLGTISYGSAVGYPPLRGWIAEQHDVDPQQVMVTNGSLQADSLLFDVLATGREVVVEDPTYDRTLQGLRRRGCAIHAVRLEADGLPTATLTRILDDGVRPAIAHVILTFHNPGGATLSLEKGDS
jgi:2-aminoadipate transaminase